MPTYDYICEACNHEWEVFQSIKDNPIRSCEKCKKRKARRQIGAGGGILFGGDGFYTTDYRSESYKSDAKKDSESSTSKSSSSKSSGSKSSGSDTGSDKSGGGSTKDSA